MVLAVHSFFTSVFPIIFGLMFFLVFGVFITVFVISIRRGMANRNAPRLTVPATVVSKRTQYTSGSRAGRVHHSGSTQYFVTFQVESGDRMELSVYGEQYGLLVEGDRGNLTFRGTLFLSFDRT